MGRQYLLARPHHGIVVLSCGKYRAVDGMFTWAVQDGRTPDRDEWVLTASCDCLQATKDIPAVKEMLKEAHEVLGYDLLQLSTDGPKEKLDDTTFAQVPCPRPFCGLSMGLQSRFFSTVAAVSPYASDAVVNRTQTRVLLHLHSSCSSRRPVPVRDSGSRAQQQSLPL